MKQNLYSTIAAVICISFSAHAQSYEWGKSIIGSRLCDVNNGKVLATDEAVFTLGEYSGPLSNNTVYFPLDGPQTLMNPGNGRIATYLTKYTPDGALQWALSLQSTDHVYRGEMAVDGDNNLYVDGYFSGTIDLNPGQGETLITSVDLRRFLIKLNAAGEFIWGQTFEESTDLQHVTGLSVYDNHIYYTGKFKGTVDFDNNQTIHELTAMSQNDFFLLKLTTNGEFVSVSSIASTVNLPEESGIPTDLKINQAGEFFISGIYSVPTDFDAGSGTTILTPTGMEDRFVMKLNIDSDFVWAVTSSTANNEGIPEIEVANDGTVYLIATVVDSPLQIPIEDLLFEKYDPNGNQIWSHRFGSSFLDQGIDIELDELDRIYICGDYSPEGVDFDLGSEEMILSNDPTIMGIQPFVARYSTDGELEMLFSHNCKAGSNWSLSYKNGALYHMGYFLEQFDADISSTVVNLPANAIPHNTFLIKEDVSVSFLDIEPENQLTFSLYPNPAKEVLSVQMNASHGSTTLTVFALDGKEVLTDELSNGLSQIDISTLAAGTYLTQVTQNDQKVIHQFVKL